LTIPISENIVDPEDIDIDTLVMKTQSGAWVYIAIAPDGKSKISLVVNKEIHSIQLVLNKKEAELIIKGLQDCLKDL